MGVVLVTNIGYMYVPVLSQTAWVQEIELPGKRIICCYPMQAHWKMFQALLLIIIVVRGKETRWAWGLDGLT